jgi:hypothetical protein
MMTKTDDETGRGTRGLNDGLHRLFFLSLYFNLLIFLVFIF